MVILGRHPDLAEVTHPDRAVVLNLARLQEQQSPYVFEGPSFQIWSRIDGLRSEVQIVDDLAEDFEAPKAQIAQDVHAFICELLELGLVEDVAVQSGRSRHLE